MSWMVDVGLSPPVLLDSLSTRTDDARRMSGTAASAPRSAS